VGVQAVSDSQPAGEQTVVNTTARIDWRKLLVPSLFIMVLPTISAIVVDKGLGTFPYITIVAILICFPTATIWVIRVALQEMDRVIAEVTPPAQDEALLEADVVSDLESYPAAAVSAQALTADGAKSSSSP
jgi:hypothetical protein